MLGRFQIVNASEGRRSQNVPLREKNALVKRGVANDPKGIDISLPKRSMSQQRQKDYCQHCHALWAPKRFQCGLLLLEAGLKLLKCCCVILEADLFGELCDVLQNREHCFGIR